MNTVKYSFLIFAISFIFISCGDMSDTYQEFVIYRTYVGKPDSLKIRNGKNRIEMSWLLLSDPKICSYKVKWNNGQDSISNSVIKTEGIDTIRILLNNLVEDYYFFDIVHYDKDGNYSVTTKTVGRSYGLAYQNSLLDRIFSYTKTGNDLKLIWGSVSDQILFVELAYQDHSGNEKTSFINNTTNESIIKDFPIGGSFKYRTAFLPEPLALDTFYTEYKIVNVEL